MKTLFTLSTLVSVAITGLASLRLFENKHYDISAILTIASFLSVSLCVVMMNNRKEILR